MPQQRSIYARVSVENIEQALAKLRAFGKGGEEVFQQLQRASRQNDLDSYGRELDKLRARFNPLFAAGQQYKAQLEEINRALKLGAISEAEHAAALQRTKAAFTTQVQDLRGVTRARQEAARAAQAQAAAEQAAAAQQAASQQAQAVELARLRQQYVPLAAAQQQYRNQLAELRRAQQLGAVSEGEYAAALARTKAAFAGQVVAMRAAGGAARLGGRGYNSLGGAVQQAGYQVGDFAVQVGSGQSAMVAFSQQASQLLGIFGPWGAVVGAGVAVVGALATGLLRSGEASSEAEEAMDAYRESLAKANEVSADAELASRRLADSHKDEAVAAIEAALAVEEKTTTQLRSDIEAFQRDLEMLQAGPNPSGPAVAQARAMVDKLTASYDEAIGRAETLHSRLSIIRDTLADTTETASRSARETAQSEIARLEADAAKAGLDGLAKLEAERDLALADYKTRLEEERISAEDHARAVAAIEQRFQAEKAALEAKAAERAAQAAEREGERRTAAHARRVEAIERLEDRALTAGLEGVAKLQAERDRDLTHFQEQLDEKLISTEEFERARQAIEANYRAERNRLEADAAAKFAEERLKEMEAQREEIARAAGRVGDRVAEFLGDSFYDRLKGEGVDVWESFRDIALRTVADLGAELIRQQIVVPLVLRVAQSQPGLLAGQGGGQAGGGLFGGGGGMPSMPGGGLTDFFGFGDSINSFGAELGFSPGIASTMPTGAPLVGANGMLTGGGATSVVPGQVANGSLMGTTSLTGFVGAAGAGFGAGMLANSLLGGNKKGGTIGSAGGALAGAAIGSVVPGIGTVAGALIGGLLGGAGGGLFGPGPSVGPNASAGLGLSNGYVHGTNATADNGGDLRAALEAADGLAEGLNALLTAAGTTMTAIGDLKVGSFESMGGAFVQSSDERALAVLRQYGQDSKQTGHGEGEAFFLGEEIEEAALRAALATAEFEDLSDTMRTVVTVVTRNKMSLEEISGAFGFAGLYEATVKAERPLSDLQQGLAELVEAFKAGAEQSAALSLDVEAWATGTRTAFDRGVRDEILGRTNPLALMLEAFERDARARVRTTIELGADLVQVERLIGLQREEVLRDAGVNLAEAIRQTLLAADLGGLSPLTAGEKLTAAQAEFDRLAAAGQAGDVGAAQAALAHRGALLEAAAAVHGSSEGFRSVYRATEAALEGLQGAFETTAALGETTAEFVERIVAEVRAAGAAPIALPESKPLPAALPPTPAAVPPPAPEWQIVRGRYVTPGGKPVNDPVLGWIYHGTEAPGAVGRAAGGPVFGPGGPTEDRIPAMLSNGEFVFRSAAVQELGLSRLQAMNDHPGRFREPGSQGSAERGSAAWGAVLARLDGIERAIVGVGDDLVEVGGRQIEAQQQGAGGLSALARELRQDRQLGRAAGRPSSRPGG